MKKQEEVNWFPEVELKIGTTSKATIKAALHSGSGLDSDIFNAATS